MSATGQAADSGLVADGFLEVDRQLDGVRARVTEVELGGGVAGVGSVNGKTGVVTLTAEDVGAVADDEVVPNFVLLIENGLI